MGKGTYFASSKDWEQHILTADYARCEDRQSDRQHKNYDKMRFRCHCVIIKNNYQTEINI
jgi:hypothetical protein